MSHNRVYNYVNKQDNEGSTSLMLASKNGHLDMVKFLVEQGDARTDIRANDGMTAFDYACVKDHKPVVWYLLKVMLKGYSEPNPKRRQVAADAEE